MQSLALALKSKGPDGEKLPVVFQKLAGFGAHIRRSQLTLIAAGSGVGKSTFLTFLAINMKDEDGAVPTLYFSADSDIATVGIRAGSMVANQATRTSEEKLLAKDEEFVTKLHEATSNIWFCFDASPSPKDIHDEIEMYAMVNGHYPALVVVDNLMDVKTSGDNERMDQDAILDYLKQEARRSGAAVVVLCHVTGEFANGNIPIPLSGLMNKIDKRPRLVLTLYSHDVNTLGVSIVKNSNGPANADGSLVVHIPFFRQNMTFVR